MAERSEVLADEYGAAELPGLSAADRAALDAAGPDLVRRVGDGVELGPVCGVLELERHRLVVRPKLLLDGEVTAAWIAYALALPRTVPQARTWSVGPAGLREVIVAALVQECETLVAAGLLRDYRREQAEDTVLRGRLDVARQLARRYGQVDRLHLRRFARRADVAENLACRAALDTAARVTAPGTLRRRVEAVRAAFPAVAPPFDAARWLGAVTHHRVNARYRAAHRWAALLLRGGGVDDLLVPGPWRAGSLLVDMNRLWERVVVRACADADGTPAGAPSIEVRETGRRRRTFRPDAVLGRPPRAVDAKYKRYGTIPVHHADIHQLLTYGRALVGEPLIVHPAVSDLASRRVEVTVAGRPLGAIAVVPVDVTEPPAAALSAALRPHIERRY